MGLSIGSRNLADTRIQVLTLASLVGAYELVFSLYVTVLPDDRARRRASIIGARVAVKFNTGERYSLGFARPEGPFEIVAKQFQSTLTPGLHLSIQPGQLAAIENLRGAGDLDFELAVIGAGIDENGEQQVQDAWSIHVARSDWIKQLRAANARDILLLEVPMPLHDQSSKWSEIADGLQRAEELFRNGEYHACVGACRTIIQDLGHKKFKNKDWAGPLLTQLSSARNGMNKDDREAAMWATLRHYTHLAHHSAGEGGVTQYSRSEAQMVLTLTAATATQA